MVKKGELALKVPEIVLIYMLIRRTQEARVDKAKSLVTLSTKKAITLRQLPRPQNREMYLRTLAEKISEAVDYTNPITRGYAAEVASRYPGGYNLAQVAAVFDHLFNNWQYVSDPSDQEYIARASETITIGLRGDCEDFAVLQASMILAIGGKARVNVGFNEQGGHSWADVKIADTEAGARKAIRSLKDLWRKDWKHLVETLIDWLKKIDYNVTYTKDKTGVYMPLDWWSAKPGGKMFPANFRAAIFPRTSEYLVIKS